MPIFLASNNATSQLAANISDTDTVIPVLAGEGALFPAPVAAGELFAATLIDLAGNYEIVHCTSRNTDALTVLRGQEGTTPKAFSYLHHIEVRPTAEGWNSKFDKAGGTLSGNLILGDDVQAQFGASLDMRMYHDGTLGGNFISSYTNYLSIDALANGGNTGIGANNSVGAYRLCAEFGGITPFAKLYYDGSEALRTQTTGIAVEYGTSGSASIKIGDARVADGLSVLDLIGDTTYSAYGLRFIRSAGANSTSDIIHRGTGALRLLGLDASSIQLSTNNTLRWSVGALGGLIAAGYSDNGAGTITATQLLLPAATTETRNIGVGQGRAGDGVSNIDLISDTTYPLYGLRVYKNAGPTANGGFQLRGTGNLVLETAEAGGINFKTSGLSRWFVGSLGGLYATGQTHQGDGTINASGLFVGGVNISALYEVAFTKNTAFNKDFAGSGVATTVARSDHLHTGVYEPAFTKNNAFNKNFAGSGVALTPSRSDHTHVGVYEPADADILKADTADTLTAGFGSTSSALTDGTTIAVTLSNSNFFTLALTATNHTISNPTVISGQTRGMFYIHVTVDVTGGYTLLLGTSYNLQTGVLTGLVANGVYELACLMRTTTEIDVDVRKVA